jgi:hypothetical protein
MKPQIINASMVIVGDVLLDEGPGPLIVLDREHKMTDFRIRFTLLLEDGLRVHRTFSGNRPMRIAPLGACRVLQESRVMRDAVGKFLETTA